MARRKEGKIRLEVRLNIQGSSLEETDGCMSKAWRTLEKLTIIRESAVEILHRALALGLFQNLREILLYPEEKGSFGKGLGWRLFDGVRLPHLRVLKMGVSDDWGDTKSPVEFFAQVPRLEEVVIYSYIPGNALFADNIFGKALQEKQALRELGLLEVFLCSSEDFLIRGPSFVREKVTCLAINGGPSRETSVFVDVAWLLASFPNVKILNISNVFPMNWDKVESTALGKIEAFVGVVDEYVPIAKMKKLQIMELSVDCGDCDGRRRTLNDLAKLEELKTLKLLMRDDVDMLLSPLRDKMLSLEELELHVCFDILEFVNGRFALLLSRFPGLKRLDLHCDSFGGPHYVYEAILEEGAGLKTIQVAVRSKKWSTKCTSSISWAQDPDFQILRGRMGPKWSAVYPDYSSTDVEKAVVFSRERHDENGERDFPFCGEVGASRYP